MQLYITPLKKLKPLFIGFEDEHRDVNLLQELETLRLRQKGFGFFRGSTHFIAISLFFFSNYINPALYDMAESMKSHSIHIPSDASLSEGLRALSIIVAVCPEGGIGKENNLPWRLPTDMRRFREATTTTSRKENPPKTMQNALIMGRKTWESIPPDRRPLIGRINVVVSTTMAHPPSTSYYVVHSLQAAIELCVTSQLRDFIDTVFVIGGASLYNAVLDPQGPFLEYVNTVYLTRVHEDLPCDVVVPQLAEKVWDTMCSENHLYLVQTPTTATDGNITMRFEQWVRGNPEEEQYLSLIRQVIHRGVFKSDRTGIGTYALFGDQIRFDLSNGRLPLLTTKRVFWRGIVEELMWFIRGDTNAQHLREKNIHIWDRNGSRDYLDSVGLKHREEMDLGPVYGFQWRHFGATYETCHTDYKGQGVDQLHNVIESLRKSPDDRRMIVTAWNPAALSEMALPPCHLLFQFYVAKGKLSCQLYQRSCDIGLGVPFNIASYSLLTMLVAKAASLRCGDFVYTLGDFHVYRNHVEVLKEQIKRSPRMFPYLHFIRHHEYLEQYSFEDFCLLDYNPHEQLKMKMAV